MPSPKELAAGLKAQEATSPNSKVMFVGQEHGKKTVLPDNVKKMAEKYGAYYEGAGGDKSDAVKYQGSWDDKASKEVKGYPKEFLYTLFTNSNVNNQKKNLTQPDKTIFDSALAAQDKWGYFKDRKFDADTLKQFLSASGMLDKSKQPATESNVKKFIDEGEGLMWPKNWEEYPNPAGKLAQKASEYRTNWLKSQKEGVYFVGSDHMKELNKPKEPAPSQLAKALAYRGEIRNTPQNSFLGGVANFLAPVSEFADQYKISDRIPFLGGMSAADLTGLKGAQSLVNDMSYGKSPISGASLQTTKVDPRVLDLAGVSGAMMPVGKALGKAALREGARQIETGTGVLGRNVIDPRSRIVQKDLQDAFPDVDFSLSQRGNQATLNKVIVPKEQRGKGVGSEFMNALTRAADTEGTQLALSPSADFGGNKARLVDFYKQFGFVPNKGRKIDFSVSESMRREPQAMMQRPKPAGLLDYQIEHKPMTIEGGAAPLHDLAKSFGEDVYGKNALQYYGSGDARESGTLRLLQALRGKPDAQVTIYRGAPSEAGGINAGDWVTLDKRVAQDYVDQALASEGKAGKVFSQKVPASHITSWPDSLMEFGYHPK